MDELRAMFKGLQKGQTKNISDAKAKGGEPCIHKHHYKPELGFRRGIDLACIGCVEELETPTLTLCPTTLRESVLKDRLQFWQKVELTDLDDCWFYNYRTAKNEVKFSWPRPQLYGSFRFHPIRVAMWLTWGDIGLMGTKTRCGERHCVNPLHQYPEAVDIAQVKAQDTKRLERELAQLKEELFEASLPKSVHKEREKESKLISLLGKRNSDGLDYGANTITPYQDALSEAIERILNV